MTIPYIVVAFYTLKTPYVGVVEVLRSSILKYNIPHYIKGYPDRGEWVRNCAMKPEFLLHCLSAPECDGKDILYVDADATFEREPENIFNDYIFYYHRYQNKEPLSGTLYIRNCPNMIRFLNEWIDLQKEHPTVFDQEVMARVIARHDKEWAFGPLPEQYIKIFDLMRRVENPVIVHHQASRRYRNRKDPIGRLTMDEFVLPQKIRILQDGTYYLVRRDRVIETYMDLHTKRIGGERRWYPNIEGSDVNVFKDLFAGKTAFIIGKGPSLDLLSQKDLKGDGPIICLNESIHVVEPLVEKTRPLFVIQQDKQLLDTCVPSRLTTKMFISYFSQECGKDFSNRFIYKPVDLGLKDTSLTVQLAIGFCKVFGVSALKMFCFDACVTKQTDYAKAIGYSPSRNGDPSRFLRHRKIIEDAARKFKLEWILPKASASGDSTQP